MTNKRTELKGIAKLTLVAVSVAAAIAWIPQSFASETTMTAKDEINLSLRYRLEHVDQDNALKDALASTLRSRLTATKKLSSQWRVQLEVDHVEVVGGDTYNSTVNGRTNYATVADPRGTDVNQARRCACQSQCVPTRLSSPQRGLETS